MDFKLSTLVRCKITRPSKTTYPGWNHAFSNCVCCLISYRKAFNPSWRKINHRYWMYKPWQVSKSPTILIWTSGNGNLESIRDDCICLERNVDCWRSGRVLHHNWQYLLIFDQMKRFLIISLVLLIPGCQMVCIDENVLDKNICEYIWDIKII